ncbi:mitochondrial coenzyme A transporter SLC25A42-like [Actinia tenebrosa]|uniref:Mitochondrial coenzyme A transporter SLC25A42-like n=1 Tax=Actinia tenebrosa TaxID=6105 RepID=A0A6P8HLX9_ACTTE|nr:mitochondrial coenzyme A transporter SLC25A42-like [Actinia tenebrosa]
MVKSKSRDGILNGDIEQHGDITHGEWYLKAGSSKRVPSKKHHVEIPGPMDIITSLASGATAGALAKTAIAPLDRTKIIFQTSNTRFTIKGVGKVLSQTFKSNGFIGLFRGNSATMARVIPYASLQFASHEQYKKLLRQEEGKGALPPVRRFIAGSLAGITAALLTYPLDMVRARLAISQKQKYTGLINAFVRIYEQEGIRTFYRGYVPTLIGIVPYAGISFFTYETCKKLFSEHFNQQHITPLHRLAFGACAGLFGQSTTYPLDIIRRRMQADGMHGERRKEYAHIWTTAKYVYKTEGLKKGLFKGLSMNWVKGPIAVGISFTVFDVMQAFFDRHVLHDKT